MNKFINLISCEKKNLYVNPDKILFVQDDEEKRSVYLEGIAVIETYASVSDILPDSHL